MNSMKKVIAIITCSILAYSSNAQRAVFRNNEASYNGTSYKVGDTLTLIKGSQSDKSFAFIGAGNRQTGMFDLDASFAKEQMVIEKIFIQRKSVYMDARLLNKTVGTPATNKVLVDFEPAIDNGEMK